MKNTSFHNFPFLLGLVFVLIFNVQKVSGQSEAYSSYMGKMEALIQNELYEKVTGFVFEAEETPSVASFIAFSKSIQDDFNKLYLENKSGLSAQEQQEAESFQLAMLMQLADLYVDAMDTSTAEEKMAFFEQYVDQIGLVEKKPLMTDDLARSIMMTLHGAIEIPYTKINTEIPGYISGLLEPKREFLRMASLTNDLMLLNISVEDAEKEAGRFLTDYPNSYFANTLTQNIEGLSKLKKGASVEDFNFVDLEGNVVKLSDFKNKVIYLDLWASWCGPCINTFKTKTPEFEQKLRSYEDVVLMYVSIDEQQDPWKNYLSKNPMRGVHLFAGEGFNAMIMKYFKVFGIPRYLIIDKENKLHTPMAPRPGDEAFEILSGLAGS